MTLWKWGMIAVPLFLSCSLAAHADPIDDQLDTVLGQLNAGDATGALANLNQITNPTPAQLIRASYYRAYAYKRKGDLPTSVTQFQGFLPQSGASAIQRDTFKTTGGTYAAKAELVFAEALFESGSFDGAAQAYGQFAADFPASDRAEDAAFRKEESLRRAGHYQAAYDYVASLPKPTANWEIRAADRQGELLAEFLRQPGAGIQAVRDVLAKYPDDPANAYSRRWLAETLFSNGRFGEAADAYGDFATHYPADPWARFASLRKEESLRAAGFYQDAYDYLLSLPTPDPATEIAVAVRRSELLAQRMRKGYDLANQLLTDVIAKYPNHPDVRFAQCRLARNLLYDLPVPQLDYARGRGILQQLIAAYPGWNMQFELRLDVADSYYLEQDYPNAMAHYQMLLDTYADNYPRDNWHAYVRYMLGDAQYRAKMRKDAFATWKDAVTRYPNDGWAKHAQRRLTEAGVR